ncbi:MAG: TetR/AcrR family transcriptional regulator [Thermoleophilia bacterium]
MAEPPAPRIRKDVARNRERLLKAAEEAFAAGGLAVPAEAIAAGAGVSIATLYRHFPDRESLVAEVQSRVNDEWNALLAEAARRERAWDGLVWLLTRLGDRAAARPDFAELARRLVARGYPGSARWNTAWSALISRAVEQGDLRADVAPGDVGAIMIAFVMAVSVFEPLAPGMRHRHLELLLDAIGAGTRPGRPPA